MTNANRQQAPGHSPSKKVFEVDGLSFNMVLVKGGTFWMGAQKKKPNDKNYDQEAWDNEAPVHKVTLSDYYIGETLVTNELWNRIMGGSTPNQQDGYIPKNTVSFDECWVFINALNDKTGEHFRLPTEAEWEFAARGGNDSHGYRYGGGDNLDLVGWHWENSGNCIHQVKTKAPNELGLYDMSGNLWEWCSDKYSTYHKTSSTNPKGPLVGSFRILYDKWLDVNYLSNIPVFSGIKANRVVCGGAYNYMHVNCRVSRRVGVDPEKSIKHIGLRLVLSKKK